MEFQPRPYEEEENQSDWNPTPFTPERSKSDWNPTPFTGESTFSPQPFQMPNPLRETVNPSYDAGVMTNIDPLMNYDEEQKLTKEEILADDQLFKQYILDPYSKRFGTDHRNKWLLDPDFDKDATKEEIFEKWQNWMRSFAGGQTITTASEVAFLQNADDNTKMMMGQTYMLFDRMPNIFSEDTSWGEMFEGLGDYARAAIIDPTTILGLGVGRAFAGAGAKAGAAALRQAVIQGAKQGLSKKAIAKVAISTPFVKEIAATGAVDLAASLAADAGYQYSMLETGVQEKYSPLQTAAAATGAIVLPSMVLGFRGYQAATEMLAASEKFKGTPFEAFTKLQEIAPQMTPEAIQESLIKMVDGELVAERLGLKVEDILSKPSSTWAEDLAAGGKIVEGMDNTLNIAKGAIPDRLYQEILYGTPESPGLVPILKDAGFFYIERFKGDKKSELTADLIRQLPDSYISRILEPLENTPFGKLTADDLADYYVMESSRLGAGLAARNLWGRTPGPNTTVRELLEGIKDNAFPPEELPDRLMGLGKQAADDMAKSGGGKNAPKRILHIQSLWKRLVTSTFSTTGLNLSGFGMTFGLNAVADVVEGGLRMGVGAATLNSRQMKTGFQTGVGGLKRFTNAMNWMDTVESAQEFLKLRPDVEEKLYRFISGGIDANEMEQIAKLYNLDLDSKWVQGSEKLTKFFQHISGAIMQDKTTKQLSFMSNLDANIRKVYGISYNDFWDQDGSYVRMMSPEFFETVLKPSLERASRETYTKPFGRDTAGRGIARQAAKMIEEVSNTEGLGMLIPFGQFMNNSMAQISDYSGMSFIYLWAKKAHKLASPSSVIDPVEEDAWNLFAKGAVGLGLTLGFFLPRELEKIDRGVRWSDEFQNEGSLLDTTFLFPFPMFALFARAIAHNIRDGEVPLELKDEVFNMFVGQSTRELGQAAEGAAQYFRDFLDVAGPMALAENTLALLSAAGQQVVSGFTRPLDPINQFAALVTDSYENIDRRQGVVAWNESMRYVDQILPVQEIGERLFGSSVDQRRNYPTAPRAPQPITNVMGHRITPGKSAFDSMLASAGRSPWKAVKWGGQYPELKNRLDGLVEPILNDKAEELLQSVDFFNLSLADKERVISKITDEAREEVKLMLSYQESNDDRLLYLMSTVYNGYSATEVKRAMRRFGMEGTNIEEIANQPDGIEKMEALIELLQNAESYSDLDE